ncbi:MAG: metal ABC transporter permease [Deltaproteobacteria bacterium]
MKNALLAVLLVTPVFAILGTMVISHRMTFFSDVLGHSALTGVAIGVVLGMGDPLWSMLFFAIILAIALNFMKWATNTTSDTVLGVFFAVTVALGVVILSRGGGFSKFTGYLIGDILAVTPRQILLLAIVFLIVLSYFAVMGNALVLIGVSPVLARSRNIAVFLAETSFTVLLAVVVVLSIRLVGILIINSLLFMPAAAARNLARSVCGYTAWAIGIGLFSGIIGLAFSYYWGTASGATIVLFSAVVYILSALYGGWLRKN